MNHDSDPTSPADPEPNPNRHDDDAADDENEASSQAQNGSATNARRQRPRLSGKVKAGLSKKLAFLLHLLMSLDALIYAELCVLYYKECVLRAASPSRLERGLTGL